MTGLPTNIHLVGVGGAGMNALAKILLAQGHRVTGSDLRGGAALQQLGDLGVTVWQGSRPESISQADLVVASSAIPDGDPELNAARQAGTEVWRRPRLLESLSRDTPTIGPTGTHGKTTTTAMLVSALQACGYDPSFIVGGELVGPATNAHLGDTDLLVLEVDEAFGTFEHVDLNGLVVTSVEPEHMEHFGSADELEESFVRVVRAVDGPVVACADDPGALRVAQRTHAITYGTDPAATWRLHDFETEAGEAHFRLSGPSAEVAVNLSRAGLHIARNASGALILLGELGYDIQSAARGVAAFPGVRRRFESKGLVSGVRIVDDYAHHPTEVRATLAEAASLGADRVWAVFQPHLYSRTRDLHQAFGSALAGADRVVVTDVYGSREEPIPGVTGRLVAASAQRAGAHHVEFISHRGDVAERLVGRLRPGDLVVTMGAGDITLVSTELATALGEQGIPGRV